MVQKSPLGVGGKVKDVCTYTLAKIWVERRNLAIPFLFHAAPGVPRNPTIQNKSQHGMKLSRLGLRQSYPQCFDIEA